MQSLDRLDPFFHIRAALALLPGGAQQPLGVIRHTGEGNAATAARIARERVPVASSEAAPPPSHLGRLRKPADSCSRGGASSTQSGTGERSLSSSAWGEASKARVRSARAAAREGAQLDE